MKRLVGVIIIIGMLASSLILIDRYGVESGNREVELVMDYSLLEKSGQQHLLPELKEAGLISLGVEFLSLSDLDRRESIGYYWGREVSFLADLLPYLEGFEEDNLYISGKKEMLKELKLLINQNLEEAEAELKDNLLILSNFDEGLVDEEIYLDREVIEEARDLHLEIIPRPAYGISPLELDRRVKDLEGIASIIFKGDRVVGYPDQIDEVGQILKDRRIKLGMIEPFIGHQRGVGSLGEKIDFEVFRVHSGNIREFERLGLDRSIERYFRAVNERNVRGLYLKPFEEDGDTLRFIGGLTKRLEEGGYRVGRANPFKSIYRNIILEILISLALLAPLYLIWAKVPFNLIGISILLVIGALFIYLIFGYRLLLELIGLGGAITYPLLTLLYLIDKADDDYSLGRAYRLFWKGSLITLSGALLLFGLLSTRGYMLQIYNFRGVKASFLFPLILGLIYYLNIYYGGWRGLLKSVNGLLEKPLLWRDLLIALLLVFVVVIYLTRTGNYPIVPVSGVEIRVRDLLEGLFIIRPRFKTFLIGHPLLFLGIGLSLKDKKYLWILPIGLVGQITILNTFSHLHTPLSISLRRTFIELVLGTLIGLLGLFLYCRESMSKN